MTRSYRGRWIGSFTLALLACAWTPVAGYASPPPTWGQLVKVKAAQFNAVYLLPGADFRTYSKVMIDPVQVKFRRNWQSEINSSATDLSRRLSDADVERIAQRTGRDALKVFTEAFAAAGYEIVTQAGPDVIRISPNVIEVYISAPDVMSPGRTRSYAVDAGEATLSLEARDSTSGTVLGHVFDRARAGGNGLRLQRATDVSNAADFERLYRRWAQLSAQGLNSLKAKPPLLPTQPRDAAASGAQPG